MCFVFLVGHGTKRVRKAIIWPRMTKNVYFGPKLAILGPKLLIFGGGSKSFGTHIRKPHRHLVCINFSGVWHQMGQKGKYLSQNDQKCQFLAGQIWPFWAKNPFFWGAKLLVPSYRIKSIKRRGLNGMLGTKMSNVDSKLWIFGAKSPFQESFFCESRFFFKRAYHQYTQGHNYPVGPTPKIPFPKFNTAF